MSLFTEEFINELTGLVMIELTDEEKDHLRKDLEKIFEMTESLSQVNTEGIPPTSHGHLSLEGVIREDKIKNSLSRETFLENSPDHIAGMIRVPAVIDKEA